MIHSLYFSSPEYNLCVALKEIQKLTKPRQAPFNRYISARAEVLKLTALGVIETGTQVVELTKILHATIVRTIDGTSKNIVRLHPDEQLIRILKFAVATIAGLAMGMINPKWAILPYQELSLVSESTHRLSKIVTEIFSKTRAWIRRHPRLACVAVIAIAYGYTYRMSKQMNLPLKVDVKRVKKFGFAPTSRR